MTKGKGGGLQKEEGEGDIRGRVGRVTKGRGRGYKTGRGKVTKGEGEGDKRGRGRVTKGGRGG